MKLFIFIVLPILLILALKLGIKNLITFSTNSMIYIPVQFKMYEYIIVAITLFLPGLNIIAFIVHFINILYKFSDGEKGYYSGYKVQEGKKNWIYSVYKFLNKKI